jgi:hypothetical protein
VRPWSIDAGALRVKAVGGPSTVDQSAEARGKDGHAVTVRARTRQVWPKFVVGWWWLMCGGLSEVVARSGEGEAAAIILSECVD